MNKRICIHCGGELSMSLGKRARYCSEKCKIKAYIKRKKLASRVQTQKPQKPIPTIERADRLFKRCFDAFGGSDPWLERRDYGQYNYNADFVLGF